MKRGTPLRIIKEAYGHDPYPPMPEDSDDWIEEDYAVEDDMRDKMPEAWKRLEGYTWRPGEHCPEYVLHVGQYDNGRMAVQVCVRGEHGGEEPWCKLTVNLVDESVGDDQFFVKLDDEAHGLAMALGMRGIIHPVEDGDQHEHVVAGSGYVERYAELWELAEPVPDTERAT